MKSDLPFTSKNKYPFKTAAHFLNNFISHNASESFSVENLNFGPSYRYLIGQERAA